VLFFSHGRVASALIRVRGRGNRSSRCGNRKNRRALARARSRTILRSLVPAESESRPGSSLISTTVVSSTVDARHIQYTITANTIACVIIANHIPTRISFDVRSLPVRRAVHRKRDESTNQRIIPHIACSVTVSFRLLRAALRAREKESTELDKEKLPDPRESTRSPCYSLLPGRERAEILPWNFPDRPKFGPEAERS